MDNVNMLRTLCIVILHIGVCVCAIVKRHGGDCYPCVCINTDLDCSYRDLDYIPDIDSVEKNFLLSIDISGNKIEKVMDNQLEVFPLVTIIRAYEMNSICSFLCHNNGLIHMKTKLVFFQSDCICDREITTDATQTESQNTTSSDNEENTSMQIIFKTKKTTVSKHTTETIDVTTENATTMSKSTQKRTWPTLPRITTLPTKIPKGITTSKTPHTNTSNDNDNVETDELEHVIMGLSIIFGLTTVLGVCFVILCCYNKCWRIKQRICMIFSKKARKDYRDMNITLNRLERMALSDSFEDSNVDDSPEIELNGHRLDEVDLGINQRPPIGLRNRTPERKVENIGRMHPDAACFKFK